jgi:hypothetical protein
VPDLTAAFNLFLMLAMAHFLGDFGLQSDRMAQEKCPGHGVTLGWGWWLVAHAAIHGFLVAWITQIPLLGLAEWVVHMAIDIGKCRRLWRLGFDQMLHIATKLAWAAFAVAANFGPGWVLPPS